MNKNKPKKRHNRDKLSGLKKTLSRLDILSDALIDKLAIHVLTQLNTTISDEISASAACSRLHSIDERAYTAYAALIEHYKGIIALYEQHQADITNEQMRDILDGIISIITSRVNLADEHGEVSGENPITAEKNRFAINVVKEFHLVFEHTQKDSFYAEISALQPHLKLALVQTINVEQAHAVYTEIANTASELTQTLYPVYNKSYQSLTTQLDDLEQRTITSHYLRMLEDEQGIIESIAKIQVNAFVGRGLAPAVNSDNDIQQNVAEQLLLAIYECYQQFHADTTPILSYLQHPQEHAEQWAAQVYSLDGFRNAIAAKLHAEEAFPIEIFEQVVPELSILQSAFDREFAKYLSGTIERKIGKDVLDKTMQEILAGIAKPSLMANKMAGVFRKANDFYLANEQALLSEPGAEIIAGINETISIKAISITDGEQTFSDDVQAKLQQFSGDRQHLCEALLKNIHSETASKLLEAFFADRTCNVANLLKNTIDEILEHQDFTAKATKTATTWQNEIDKLTLKFKREVLLYEMGTFDEIMNFSVGRLISDAGYTPSPTLAYTTHLEQAQRELIEILAQNNIQRITPQPHTPFNAKEHDVLTAEVTEGFTKGEIVKAFANGYKENDTVLVRAGVIAAR